jgi:hypothetical protein
MSDKEPQYYTLPLKSAVNIMTDAERGMKMLSSVLQELIKKHDIDSWTLSPIPDYMDGYLNAKTISDFLKKKIEEPDEAVREYLKQNNINGLLFTADELSVLYTLVSNYEQTKLSLKKQYGFSTLLN